MHILEGFADDAEILGFPLESGTSTTASESNQTLSPTSRKPTQRPASSEQNETRLEGNDGHDNRTHVSASDESSTTDDFSVIQEPLPNDINGYQILAELGRGGLGIVYLAKQASLQRKVALKVIRSGLTGNAMVIARFIREAYAAAQLTHHNVVQIYDLGSSGDKHYFSMEYVDGKSLADVIKSQGALPAEQAAGYILQAARGLQFAHSQGMVHRDIKPANLLLSSSGVVKVGDLGLVKVPGEDLPMDRSTPIETNPELTSYGTTLGTANYMAPEQARDASGVDHRADIYALGCTFFALLAGEPPFKGHSIEEVMSQHSGPARSQSMTRLGSVPKRLRAIVNKMMANDASERYQSLATTIRDLEEFLGIQGGADFHPREAELTELETAVKAYTSAPSVIMRRWLPFAVFGVFVIALVLSLVLYPASFMAPLAFVAASALMYGVLSGIHNRSEWMSKVRELISINFWSYLFRTIAAGALFAGLAWLFGPLAFALTAFGLVAGAVAGWSVFLVSDKSLTSQRAEAKGQIEKLLRKLRIQGVEEKALRLFVARFSGADWEELFEDLFGYQAKRRARNDLARLGHSERLRQFRPWLDRFIERVDQRLISTKRTLDISKLKKVEQAALRQQGLSAADASYQADQIADAMVSEATENKMKSLYSPMILPNVDPKIVAEQKRIRQKRLIEDARAGRLQQRVKSWQRRLSGIVGPTSRLFLAFALLLCFGYWVQLHLDLAKISSSDATNAATSLFDDGGEGAGNLIRMLGFGRLRQSTTTLHWPLVGRLLSGFGVGIAGGVLLLTTWVRGWKSGILLVVSALVFIAGPHIGLALGANETVMYQGVYVFAGLIALSSLFFRE
ncbi:MAG: serine/threonine-protein kinase [Pirellulaceae bacterium]